MRNEDIVMSFQKFEMNKFLLITLEFSQNVTILILEGRNGRKICKWLLQNLCCWKQVV